MDEQRVLSIPLFAGLSKKERETIAQEEGNAEVTQDGEAGASRGVRANHAGGGGAEPLDRARSWVG